MNREIKGNNYKEMEGDLKDYKKDKLTSKWLKKNSDKIGKYRELLSLKSSNEIVKLFHFIWIGENKIPNAYVKYIKSWIRHHPDWKFCLWTDKNIPKLINAKAYKKAEKFAMKADILRYELLYIFGGVYVDCDFLCYKNIEEKISDLRGFSAWESEDYIAIGLMGFVSGHPFLRDVIKQVKKNCKEQNKQDDISAMTGPVMFTGLYETKEYNLCEIDIQTVSEYYKDLYIFPPEFCYDYTYQDHNAKKELVKNPNSYAVHLWGNSWGNTSITWEKEPVSFNRLLSECANTDDSLVFYPSSFKNKIVHIMGVFFSGGIERLIKYFDDYGDLEKNDYYLLCMPYVNDTVYYTLNNIKMYHYKTQTDIKNILNEINPDVILDHVSIYFENTNEMYENFNRNNVLTFIHSANRYESNVDSHHFKNCIHLYKENNKHPSWNNIPHEYYVTLGTELEPYFSRDRKKSNIDEKLDFESHSKINVGIIGRIAQEKIPIEFFRKLCSFSRSKIVIHIYGEKDLMYAQEYNDEFDTLMAVHSLKTIKTEITYHGFISPNKIGDVYKSLDVLLIPSEYETGSFSCIEALNYGVVVIARNVYGMKYIIDNTIGYLCKDDEEILSVLQNISFSDIRKKAKLSYERSRNYDIITQIEKIESILYTLI